MPISGQICQQVRLVSAEAEHPPPRDGWLGCSAAALTKRTFFCALFTPKEQFHRITTEKKRKKKTTHTSLFVIYNDAKKTYVCEPWCCTQHKNLADMDDQTGTTQICPVVTFTAIVTLTLVKMSKRILVQIMETSADIFWFLCLPLPPAHLVVVLVAVLQGWTIEAIVFLCKTSK